MSKTDAVKEKLYIFSTFGHKYSAMSYSTALVEDVAKLALIPVAFGNEEQTTSW
ncbi:hypothetical protein M7I_3362 [Glarea lozoyensis 74030]|uniref:Uncharacterized protein n=1 Tax=Glarea lozoyensis (strain ATCC 74030 / MF5533) TaxID=1104152 RepID=H0ELA2_GLAL7|nr:hypothetical protein M7I_3362 [Glarea lozoyensis 74030]